jgi:hypothetical protein
MAEFGGFGESSSEPSVEAGEDIGLQEVPEAAAEIETVEVPTEVPDIPEETLELGPVGNEGGAVESMPEDDMLEFDDSDDEPIPDIPEESLDLVSESGHLADLEEQDLTPEMNQSDTEEASESDHDTETEVQDEGDTDLVDINNEAVSDVLEEPVSDGVELDAKEGESESGNAIEVEDPVAVGPGGIERPEISRSPERLPEIRYGRDAPPGSGIQPGDSVGDDDVAAIDHTEEAEENVASNETLAEESAIEEVVESEVVDQRIEVDDSEELKFGHLEPNTTYVKNGYEFHTDSKGRVDFVFGELVRKDGLRSTHQTEVGKEGLEGDEGGHLIGTRFDGPPDGFNLVPQNSNLNRAAWKSMEDQWAKALDGGQKVTIAATPVYLDDVSRPIGFDTVYSIDDEWTTKSYYNESSKEQEI